MHSPASGTRWCSSSSLHPLNWPLCAAHSLKGHVWQPCPGLSPDPVLFEACHATPRQGGTAPPTGISPIQWISGRVRIRGSEKEQSWGHQIQVLHFTDEETDRWPRTHLESGRETGGSLGLPAQFTCHPRRDLVSDGLLSVPWSFIANGENVQTTARPCLLTLLDFLSFSG